MSQSKICVPVCEQRFETLRNACERAGEWADVIELRLDCLEITPGKLNEVLQDISRPVILTFRPSEQGGKRELTREERLRFWNDVAPRGESVWWDVEGDLAHDLSPEWARVIVSHHDFNGVPNDLDDIYKQLAATPAQVVKIAVQANEITDCIPVFKMLDRARQEGREVIPIAMGNAGIPSRVLGPSRGAFLTYGSLDKESTTAPGQITARNLRSLYRIDRLDRDTIVCGLIGLPVMQSVSPKYHNGWFAAAGLNGVYLPLEVKELDSFMRRMVDPRTRELTWNLRGLSVTTPHKQTVMNYLDWIEPTARKIGAVNTIVIEADRLLGYNADAPGFIDPLRRKFESLAGRRAAVIGAGGAARAVSWALSEQNANVTIFARNLNKAESLGMTCQSLQAATFEDFDLVVNTTPLGSGVYVDQSPATAEQLTGARCAYDLIYNPIDTRFLREARKVGCDTIGGLEMLVAQAKIQFKLWTGKNP